MKRCHVRSPAASRSHTPPGLRKSGMPDSVLTPAPVKTTGRRAEVKSAARRAVASSTTPVSGDVAGDVPGDAFVGAGSARSAWDAGGRLWRDAAPRHPAWVVA